MSDTGTVMRELREKFAIRWEWLMVVEGIGVAIIGSLTIAMFARFAWADAVSQNLAGLAFAGFGLGMTTVFTWRGVRFGRRLRAASAAFDATVDELRAEAATAYRKGREDVNAHPLLPEGALEAAFREGYDFGQADAGWKVVDASDAWRKSGTGQNAKDALPPSSSELDAAIARIRELEMRPCDVEAYAPVEEEAMKALVAAINPLKKDTIRH